MIEPGRAPIPSDLLLEEKIIIVRRVSFLVLIPITYQVVILMENLIRFCFLVSSLVLSIWDQLAVLPNPLVCRIVDPNRLDALYSAI